MILFWLSAGLLSGLAAWLATSRARGAAPARDGDMDRRVQRQALTELDEGRARGLLDDDGLRAARAEVARRLRPLGEGWTEHAGTRREAAVVTAALGVAALAALALYFTVGSLGSPDLPRAARVAEWAGRLETLGPEEMAAVAEANTRRRPQDPEAWLFLGRAQAAAGEHVEAAQALRRALRLQPGRAETWAELGEVLARASGRVDGDARRAFERALTIDPGQASARYFLGAADVADGRVEAGVARWRGLLAGLDPRDPRRAALEAEISAAGAPRATPEAVDPSAVGEEQIRGMVAGLAARLEQRPDDVDGWVRLIRAYGVLGDTAAREAAAQRARRQFATRRAELAAIEAAAR
ncbi:MAG TPA: c-type cytochrome biogenesis protein CcmI [Caulobacteraceae bacterium]|jgi:cytochrome c-type biogenesis protein CcmH